MAAPEPAAASDGIRRMYQFLLQAEELRSKPVRTLDGAARTLWLGELPRDAPSVASGLFDTDAADTWLRVDRVHRDEPPALPGILRPWIGPAAVRDRDRADAPELRARALAAVGAPDGEASQDPGRSQVLDLAEHPDREELAAAHRDWSQTWRTWAERERRVAPLVKLYEEVYRIHQEAVDLGESYELVLGVGHLTWSAENQPVRRHLLTRRMVLTMDEQGRIELTPDPEAPGFTLEEDMLEAAQRLRDEPRSRVVDALTRASEHTGPDGAEHLHTALREWALAASADARYEQGAEYRAASGSGTALVAFAPAVILRERPKRGQLNALSEIGEAVGRHGAPTGLLRHIIGDEARATTEKDPDEGEGATPRRAVPGDDDLYFSLPSNAEQRLIASRLQNSDLVVVQGPPGTGKTHTIANLVTDLLARGQRILITSQTPRALKVLKDKLPEPIRPLAVSRTGDGVEAQRELEGSVHAILERQADNDPGRADAQISELRTRLEHARGERDRALKDLRAIREQETYEHPRRIGDYSGKLSAIAERLAAEEPHHSWLGGVGSDEPPFGAEQALALLHAARAYTPEHRALAAEVPEAARIPAPSKYADALEAIARAEAAAERAAGFWGGDLDGLLNALPRERCARLRALVDGFTAARDITARLDSRRDGQRTGVLAGREREVRTQAQAVRTALEAVERELGQVGRALITGLEGFGLAEALGYATDLHEAFASGSGLHGLFGMRTKVAKRNAPFLASVTVDGRVPDTEQAARLLLHRIEAERALFEAENALNAEAGAQTWKDARRRTARLADELRDLDQLLELAAARTALIDAVTGLPRLASLDWADRAEVDKVAVLLAAVDADHDAAPARHLVEGARTELRAWSDRSHPEPGALRLARVAVDAADPEGYAEACAQLERVREAAHLEEAYEAALAGVSAGHRSLAHAIAEDPGAPEWEGRLTRLEQAWAWSVWNRRLAELTDPAAEERCRARLNEADGEARLTMGKLAAARAWRACLDRLTPGQEVALRSYQQSVRRIGRGTGKHVHHYQRQARESLRECQPAVPAWIMPLYQVVSTIPMDTPGVFDVVIVDEASQSGPEALMLAWLGKRLVVVGDDKQVSPANVGIDQEQVFTLQERHLGTFPSSRRSLFSPNRSLFDIASGLAGSRGQLMLKEHFRCMPEIIGFSNENFYGGRLQPLRQYGADRLPPLRTVHVADGMLEGKGSARSTAPKPNAWWSR
ncbi:AAA family ATPase [Nocardiopsis sp. ARC36]